MTVHYQVYANFSFTKSKPSLVGISISSTQKACTTLPIFPYPNTYLTISRIFQTLSEAKTYIAYLHRVYPHSPIPPLVLAGKQQDLFQEVSNELL